MIYLLDQTALVHLLTEPAEAMRMRVRTAIGHGDQLAMSAVTLAQLEAIAGRMAGHAGLRQVLDLLQGVVQVLDWPAAAAHTLGRLQLDAETSHQDLQVIAHAISINAELIVAGPQPWARIPSLSLQDWARPTTTANPG